MLLKKTKTARLAADWSLKAQISTGGLRSGQGAGGKKSGWQDLTEDFCARLTSEQCYLLRLQPRRWSCLFVW